MPEKQKEDNEIAKTESGSGIKLTHFKTIFSPVPFRDMCFPINTARLKVNHEQPEASEMAKQLRFSQGSSTDESMNQQQQIQEKACSL